MDLEKRKSESLSKTLRSIAALEWWRKLCDAEKKYEEYKMFGHGDVFEDNTINENDIIKMYKSK